MRTGQGKGKRAALAALVLAIGGYAAPASANSPTITAYYHDPLLTTYVYPTTNQNAVISIDVKASVGGTCGFSATGAPNATVNAGAIAPGFTATVPFTAECTAPWRIAVSSTNGALKNAASVPTGYANAAPYNVALNIPYDTGSATGTVTGTCPVAELDQALGSSPCLFKGTASTTNGLQIPRSFGLAGSTITMSAPVYGGSNILIAGNYSDTLIVTVSPAV